MGRRTSRFATTIRYVLLYEAFIVANHLQSKVTISEILFKNVHGITTKNYAPLSGSLVCSSPDVCSNIVAEDIHVFGYNATDLFTCLNLDESTLGVNCTDLYLGYN